MHAEERFGIQVIQKDCGSKNECRVQSQGSATLSRDSSVFSQWVQHTESLVHRRKSIYCSYTSELSLIRKRQHFSRDIMVSVGVSKMGKTRLVFVGQVQNQQQILLQQPPGTQLLTRQMWPSQLDLSCSKTALPHTQLSILLSFWRMRMYSS